MAQDRYQVGWVDALLLVVVVVVVVVAVAVVPHLQTGDDAPGGALKLVPKLLLLVVDEL